LITGPALTPLEPWIARKIGNRDERSRLTRDEVRDYQLARLRDTLCLARERSPFYRRHLADVPTDLSCLDDLARFPLTTADDLRENSLQFVCVSQGEIQRVVTLNTSGTTGSPKRLYFTRADQELTIDFFHVGMSTLAGPDDRVLILLPCERPGGVGDLLATALQRLDAEGIRHGPVRDAPRTLDAIVEHNVNCLVGTPVQVLSLAWCGESLGGGQPLTLKRVLLTTDHVPDAICRTLESAWGCEVYTHYGMTEMGLGGGVECQARCGYHLREADLYFEIIDPVTDDPVQEGEIGEVVFTTLTRRGMPLIRYRTGDVSRFVPGGCPCGTILKTLARVRSRSSGYVEVAEDCYLTQADLDEALFSIEGMVNFSATLTRGRDGDCLCIGAIVVEERGQTTAWAIQRRLDSIPSIRLAQEMGQLDVSWKVRVADWSSTPVHGLAKRKIVDVRDP
jgi:phenylacetate-CoA ligase